MLQTYSDGRPPTLQPNTLGRSHWKSAQPRLTQTDSRENGLKQFSAKPKNAAVNHGSTNVEGDADQAVALLESSFASLQSGQEATAKSLISDGTNVAQTSSITRAMDSPGCFTLDAGRRVPELVVDGNSYSRGSPKQQRKLFDPKKDKVPLLKRSGNNGGGHGGQKGTRVSGGKHAPSCKAPNRSGIAEHVDSNPPAQADTMRNPGATDVAAYRRWKETVCVREAATQRTDTRVVLMQKQNDEISNPTAQPKELKSGSIDQATSIARARRLYADIRELEVQSSSTIGSFFGELEAVMKLKLALALLEQHRKLFDLHYDFLILTTHPPASKSLKRLSIDFEIHERLWSVGVEPILKHLVKPDLTRANAELIESISSFLYHTYSALTSLLECVPGWSISWTEHLARLATAFIDLKETDSAMEFQWAHIVRDWYQQAIHLKPERGQYWFEWARGLPKDRNFWKIFALQKASTSKENVLEAQDFVTELMTETRSDFMTEVTFPVSAANQQAFCFCHALLQEPSAVDGDFLNFACTAMQDASTTLAFTTMTAYVNVSSIHTYFSTFDGNLPKRFESTKTDTFVNVVDHCAFSLAMLSSIGGTACSSSTPHLFVWLIYLLFAQEQSYWTALRSRMPWALLTRLINTHLPEPARSKDSRFSDTMPLHFNNTTAHHLPEDVYIRGSIFDRDQWWPTHLLTDLDDHNLFSVQTSTKAAEQDKHDAVRRERIEYLAHLLVQDSCDMSYDKVQKTFFCSSDEQDVLGPVSKITRGMLVEGYTTIVVDADALLHQRDLLATVVDKFMLVVPLISLLELDRSREESRLNQSAREQHHAPAPLATFEQSILWVEKMLQARRIKVVTHDGSQLRDISWRAEVDFTEHCKDYQTSLLTAVRHQVQQHLTERGAMIRQPRAELAVLLSEQFALRKSAQSVDLTAISALTLKMRLEE